MAALAAVVAALSFNSYAPGQESIAGSATIQSAPDADPGARIDALLKQSNDLVYAKTRFQEAEGVAKQALDLSRTSGDRLRTMRSLHALASIDFYLARFTEALDLEQESLRIGQQVGDKRALSIAFNGIASILRALGRFEEALGYFNETAALTRELSDLPMQWTVTRNIGVLFMEMGDVTRAETPLKEALRIANDLKAERWKNQITDGGKVAREASLETLGNWEIAREHYSAAASYLEQALADHPDLPALTAEILTNLANVREKLGESQRAIELQQQAIDRWQAAGNPTHPLMLADLAVSQESLGRLPEALASARQALELVRETGGNAQYEWQIEGRLGHIERAMGRNADALREYQSAIRSIEALRASALNTEAGRAFAVATRRSIFEEAVDLLHDLGREADAFSLAERGRARAFLDMLATSRAGLIDELTAEQRTREDAIMARISALQRDLWKPNTSTDEGKRHEAALTAAEDELEAFHVQVRQSNPRFGALRYPEPIDLGQIQRALLPDGSGLVEYLLGEKRSFAWVVTKDGLDTFVLPSRKEIEDQATAYRKVLSEPVSALTMRQSLVDVSRLGSRLYQSIFQSLQTALASAQNVVVVPDGGLVYLPFEALVIDSRRTASGEMRPSYLAETTTMVYGPSASALVALRTDTRESGTLPKMLLAFGDPYVPIATPADTVTRSLREPLPRASAAHDYAERGFSVGRLPHTRDEVLGISRLFPASQREIHLGAEAREETIKSEALDRFRFIHFATHGFMDEIRPGRSGILLSHSPRSTEDGILQIAEILRLRMNADLVTLSACGTGLGKLVNGEGILGLTRAIFYAGARNVAVSLWNVNDSATAVLMTAFYRNIKGGSPKGDAMRQAKLALLRGPERLWRHPYFWASFVVQGEGR